MQFIGIEIAPAGTKAIVLDLDSAETPAEASVSHSWIDGLPPGYREQAPSRWIEAIDRVIRECLANPEVDPKQVAATGVAGPQRGSCSSMERTASSPRPSWQLISRCESKPASSSPETRKGAAIPIRTTIRFTRTG